MARDIFELYEKDPVRKEIFREIFRHIYFGQVSNGLKAGNFDAIYVKATFASPNVEVAIPHGLVRIPTGMMQIGDFSLTTTSGIQLTATKIPTSTTIYLKSAVAGTVTLLLW
jgi:hypothetical protein